MKAAVIGSRNLKMDISEYIPGGVTEIISGGAAGIDTAAERYAKKHGIPTKIFLPDYESFGSVAPLVRNRKIVEAADIIIALWDGDSRGTMHAVNYARELGKKIKLYKV